MKPARWLSQPGLTDRLARRTSAGILLCFTTLPCVAQNQIWVRQLGTGLGDWMNAAAPDSAGGVFVGGTTEGPLGGPNPSLGFNDAWFARFDSAGNRLWIHQFGTKEMDGTTCAAPDGSGGVYGSGVTTGNLGGPHVGEHDVWIARFDSAGNPIWLRQLGSFGNDWALACTPDSAGGVYVSGETWGNLGGTLAGVGDAWFARYDAAGNQLWIRQIGTSTYDNARAVAPDVTGGIFVGGATLGDLVGPNAGYYDAWLARYDSAGNQLWIRQFGTAGSDGIMSAVPDGSGGVYVSGSTDADLGGQNAGYLDVWLARYDSVGNQLWIRQFGASWWDVPYAMAPDSSGGVYVGGETDGGLGGPNAGPPFSTDAWLAQYDSAGNRLWLDQFGTPTPDAVWAFAPAPGGLYLGGFTRGSLGGPSAGFYDAWLARYDGSCGGMASFCTAKVNSAGCTPRILSTGSPSASAGNGFVIRATNILDNKFGLFFYGKTGQQAVPFQGGTLCANAPLVRTVLQNSGGMPPCGGTFNMDFNVYIAGGKDPGLIAGATVDGQYWSRDPGFAPPNNTSLTDALHFVICP